MRERTAASGPTAKQPPGFARRNAWMLASTALLAVIAIVTGATWTGQHAVLARQESRISELDRQLTAARLANSERVEKDLLTALGFSRSRRDRDASIITALVTTVFTWDSGTAYAQARTNLKERYGLSDSDTFLTRFMPPSHYNQDAGGNRYYYIDAQRLKSSLGSEPDIEITSVAADDYSYTVLVDVEATSDSATTNNVNRARVTTDRRILLTLTVNADRRISGLSGTPAGGTTRHSK